MISVVTWFVFRALLSLCNCHGLCGVFDFFTLDNRCPSYVKVYLYSGVNEDVFISVVQDEKRLDISHKKSSGPADK